MSIISEFNIGDNVVYPSHGVGEIINIESQIIANTKIRVYVVSFPQDKMIVKVPVNRATISGLRSLATTTDLAVILSTLQSKPITGNRMWSRRAIEYESKINSGNIIALAEVVRDLYKNVDSDRSFSERNIYESALNRLAGEIAILQQICLAEAKNNLIEVLREKVAA